MYNEKYKKLWKTLGIAVGILVTVSMVLLYAAPGLYS